MNVTLVSVDVEADGPCPGLFSMVSVGAVVIEPCFERSFYAELAPVTSRYSDAALKACGFTREETKRFQPAKDGMLAFADWLVGIKGPKGDRLLFVSDNAGFDWQFVNYYFHAYVGSNPFGFSPFSLTSFYKGYVRNMRASFRHLRDTKHSHNALDDALGNAEAMLKLCYEE